MSRKTPKTVLHELLVINLCPHPPVFATSKIGGYSHMPIYESTVTIMSWQLGVSNQIPTCAGRGQGRSKKLAEHEAAVEALLQLKEIPGLGWPNIYVTPKVRPCPVFYDVPEQQRNAPLLIEAGTIVTSPAEYYAYSKMARNNGVY